MHLALGHSHTHSQGGACCRFGWEETQADKSAADNFVLDSSAADNFVLDSFAEDNSAGDKLAEGSFVVGVGLPSWVVAEVSNLAWSGRRLGSPAGFGSVREFADHLP